MPRLPSNPKLKLALGIGLLALSLVLGNTLAANISLNSGGNVEFGQGVALTTACDDEVTVTPYSTFVNETGAGDFIFTNLSVSDISGECDGKIFTIKAYEDGSNDPLDLYLTSQETYYNSLEVLFDSGEFTLIDAGLDADDIVTDEGEDADNNGFTVTLYTEGPPPSEAVASARDVYRITIESRDNNEDIFLGDPIPSAGVRDCSVETPSDIRYDIMVYESDFPLTYTFINCDYFYTAGSVEVPNPTIPYAGGFEAGTPSESQTVIFNGPGAINIYVPGVSEWIWTFFYR